MQIPAPESSPASPMRPTEVPLLLGEQDRIVGVSGYATRPPRRAAKPRVSAFKNARFDAILALKPDLVLTFSDVQAEITRQLVLRGVTVLNFNQRSIAEILDMIAALARLVGKPDEGLAIVQACRAAFRPSQNPRKLSRIARASFSRNGKTPSSAGSLGRKS